MIGRTLSHYKITAKLGEGGMGEVYLAEDTELQRKVALKVLPEEVAGNPDRLARFHREAKAVAQLNHPNIVTIYSIANAPLEGADQSVTFFIMELVEGKRLSDLIPHGGFPLKKLFDIAIPLADAVSAAHQRGITHRDLKPGNVMVTKQGRVKVLDFGLAKMTDPPPGAEDSTTLATATLTSEGKVLGTVAYMSPEQAEGKPLDHRSDIFSLGVLLSEMATGRRPFLGGSPAQVISAILRDTPMAVTELRAELPYQLARIIKHCLEKNPEDRFQTARDVHNELRELSEELAPRRAVTKDLGERDSDARKMLDDLERRRGKIGDEGPTPIQRPYRAPARRQVWILAALLLLVLLAATTWLYFGRDALPFGSGTVATRSEVGKLLDQALLYEQRGDLRETLETAESFYRKALQLAGDDPMIQARLALLLARIQRQYPEPGRVDEVRALADRALEADPGPAPAWVARGILFLLNGDAEAAELAGREAQTAAPDDFNGYVLVGEALIDQGEVDAGLTELQRGVDVGAGHIWARLILGSKFRGLARYEDAAREFRKVLEYAPDSPNALNNLGLVLLDMGRAADALPFFRRVMELYPDDRAATNLGFAYFKQNQLEEAIAAFDQAHELAPQRPTHARNLADTYEMQGDLATAREWFETALELYDRALTAGGPQGSLIGLRAVCAAKLGRHKEAAANLERGLELSPQNTYLLFVGAQVHALAGNEAEMYRFADRALEAGISRDEFRTDLSFRLYRDQRRFRSLLEG